mgnify:FL=1
MTGCRDFKRLSALRRPAHRQTHKRGVISRRSERPIRCIHEVCQPKVEYVQVEQPLKNPAARIRPMLAGTLPPEDALNLVHGPLRSGNGDFLLSRPGVVWNRQRPTLHGHMMYMRRAIVKMNNKRPRRPNGANDRQDTGQGKRQNEDV